MPNAPFRQTKQRERIASWFHEIGLEVTDSEVRLTLYSGDVVTIGRYEMSPSTLTIRGQPCCLEILPRAENSIEIRPKQEPSLKRRTKCRKPKNAS